MARIPEKHYFKIGEVAEVAGVKPSVLRYWETEFRSIRPEKTRSNQRLYARKHVERVLQIKELLYDRGFTIAGAKKELREAVEVQPPSAPTVPLVKSERKLLERVSKELRELLQLCDE